MLNSLFPRHRTDATTGCTANKWQENQKPFLLWTKPWALQEPVWNSTPQPWGHTRATGQAKAALGFPGTDLEQKHHIYQLPLILVCVKYDRGATLCTALNHAGPLGHELNPALTQTSMESMPRYIQLHKQPKKPLDQSGSRFTSGLWSASRYYNLSTNRAWSGSSLW